MKKIKYYLFLLVFLGSCADNMNKKYNQDVSIEIVRIDYSGNQLNVTTRVQNKTASPVWVLEGCDDYPFCVNSNSDLVITPSIRGAGINIDIGDKLCKYKLINSNEKEDLVYSWPLGDKNDSNCIKCMTPGCVEIDKFFKKIIIRTEFFKNLPVKKDGCEEMIVNSNGSEIRIPVLCNVSMVVLTAEKEIQ